MVEQGESGAWGYSDLGARVVNRAQEILKRGGRFGEWQMALLSALVEEEKKDQPDVR